MSLNELYNSLCLAKDDEDTFEVIVENKSVIWGSTYDVVDSAMKLIGNIEHEYTSKHDSPTLDSILTVSGTSLNISANPEQGDNHEVIVALSKLLTEHEVLFVSERNGNSDLAFIIDTKQNVQENRSKYGYKFSLNFVPVTELPDLWNTPGNQLDAAVESYAAPINKQLTRRSTGLHKLSLFLQRYAKKIASLFRR